MSSGGCIIRRVRHRSLLRLALCLPLLCAGCGVAAYEKQLADTNELFTYRNKLDAALAEATWTAPDGFGISMRVPREFSQIQPPPPPPEGEEPVEVPEDRRQPTYLGIEFPDLIAAFDARLPTQTGQANAFFYILGNHQRFLDQAASDGQGPEPATFLQDLRTQLETTLQVTAADSGDGARDNVRYTETIPRSERFALSKQFTAVSYLPPPEALPDLPELRFQLYEHEAGPVQVAFLLVYPTSVRTNPVESLRIALETLTVVGEPPSPPRPGEAASGAEPSF